MRSTVLSLLSKLALMAAQFIATVLVLRYLSPRDQGYYYAFVSMIAVQGIFELGLGQVVVVSISQAIARCRAAPAGTGAGLPARASAIAHSAFVRYAWIAVVFVVLVAPAGATFFALSAPISVGRHVWLLPWLALVATTATRFPIIWLEAVVEGSGELDRVFVVRTVAQLVWTAVIATAFALGLGLYAPAVAALFLTLASGAGYAPYRRLVTDALAAIDHDVGVQWSREVGAFRRRVSGTWIASFLVSQTAVPIAFAALGAAEAGRAGIAFQVAAALGVLAGAIITPRTWVAARLVASGDWRGYQRLFRRTLTTSTAVVMAAAMACILALALVPGIVPAYAPRLPPAASTSLLLGAASINAFMACVAVFARANHEERFVVPLFLVAATTVCGSILFGARTGFIGIAATHLVAALAITLPWSLHVTFHLLGVQTQRNKVTEVAAASACESSTSTGVAT
jgi:hypothetical protein